MKESLLDGTPKIATEKHLKLPWFGGRKCFKCGLCENKFKLDDQFRFIYANFSKSPATMGNFFVCKNCDGENKALLIKRF